MDKCCRMQISLSSLFIYQWSMSVLDPCTVQMPGLCRSGRGSGDSPSGGRSPSGRSSAWRAASSPPACCWWPACSPSPRSTRSHKYFCPLAATISLFLNLMIICRTRPSPGCWICRHKVKMIGFLYKQSTVGWCWWHSPTRLSLATPHSHLCKPPAPDQIQIALIIFYEFYILLTHIYLLLQIL